MRILLFVVHVFCLQIWPRRLPAFRTRNSWKARVWEPLVVEMIPFTSSMLWSSPGRLTSPHALIVVEPPVREEQLSIPQDFP